MKVDKQRFLTALWNKKIKVVKLDDKIHGNKLDW